MGGQAFGREIIKEVPGIGVLDAWGGTVPTVATPGYAKGCLFRYTGGTSIDTVLYVNVGTVASCDFNVAILS